MIWRYLTKERGATCSGCGRYIDAGDKRLGCKEKRRRWKIYCGDCAGIAYKKG